MKQKQKTLWAAAAAGVLLLTFFGLRQYRRAQENQVTVGTTFALNTVIDQKWFGPRGEKTQNAVNDLISGIEDDISLHRTGSEIDRINQAAGKEYVSVSERTFDLLRRAKELSLRSEDAFDITVAPLVTLWNITGLPPHEVPAPEAIEEKLSYISAEELLLREEDHSVMLAREGMSIDLGGVAKGWIADRVRETALEEGISNGYVSLGGNLMIIGGKPDGSDYIFGVRDPRGEASDYIGTLTLRDKTMATTGDYERFFMEDGVRYHHVLDPKTGYPANEGLISVTVVSEDGALADYLSTTLFVLGRDAALAAMESPDYALILVDDEKNIYYSQSLQGNFNPNEENARGYQFHSAGQ